MNVNQEKSLKPQKSANWQRDREWQALKTFLAVSIPCSIALHFVTLSALPRFGGLSGNSANQQQDDLLEIKIVEELKEPDIKNESDLEPLPDIAENPENAIAFVPTANLSQTSIIGNPDSAKGAGNLSSTDVDQPKNSEAPAEASKDLVKETSKILSSSTPNTVKVQPKVLNLFTGKGASGGLVPNADGKTSTRLESGKTGDRTSTFGNGRSSTLGKISAPFGLPTSDPNSNNNTPNNSSTSSTSSNPTNNTSGNNKIRCQSCTKPDYPNNAKERGLEGEAKVAVDVDANGNVINVRLINSSGHPELDEAAKQAARNWKFDPSQSGKQAIPAKINFQIENSDYARRNQEQRQAVQREEESRELETRKPESSPDKNVIPKKAPENQSTQTQNTSKPELVKPISAPEKVAKPTPNIDSSKTSSEIPIQPTAPIVDAAPPIEKSPIVPEPLPVLPAGTNTPVNPPNT